MSLDDEYTKGVTEYAGFVNRLIAICIDSLVLLVPARIFFGESLSITDPSIGTSMPILVVSWLYFALMESSNRRGTIGKLVMNMKVTDMSGGQISFTKASIRFFGKILSSLIFGIGYIMAAFSVKKQALHDKIAKCLVLKVN